jgi:hypothetical protein
MTTYNAPIENPYNPNFIDITQDNIPLDEIILRAIQTQLMKARVMLPAQVIAINSVQNVNVQPLLKTRYIDGQIKNLPPIQQVPVSMLMGSDYSIKLPIAVNDIGYVIFCDRSLDNYLAGTGQIVDPQASRAHDYADAVFVPGLVPFAKQLTDKTTDLVVTNGKAIFKFQKAGTFIATNSTNELMDLLVQITNQLEFLAQTLSNDTVNTIYGLSPLNSLATYANIKTTVDGLKARLTTLKGS